MKNSAKWEVRVGLLLGLAFIVAFGMILSELRDPVTQPEAEKQTAVNTSYYNTTQPSLERTYRVENENINPVPVAPPQNNIVASHDVRVDMRDLQAAVISRDESPLPVVERPAPQRPVRREPSRRIYRVVDGDTLYEISAKAYGAGKGSMWRKIYQANRDKLPNPSAIKPGQTLVIPTLDQPADRVVDNAPQQEALDHMQRYVAGSSATGSEPSRNRNTSRAKVHVVKSGENLTKIARRYFNDSRDRKSVV